MDTETLYQEQLATHLAGFRRNFHSALTVMMLWVIVLGAVYFTQDRLFSTAAFAIQPQQWQGLIGVLTAPLLHGSMEHLSSNAFGFLVLGTLAGSMYPRASLWAWPIVWLGSGLGTWFISLGGHHIGASGLTVGLMFFLIGQGLRRRDRMSLGALFLALFFFGGMVLSFLPREQGISWEYHLSGAVFGLLCGLALSGLDAQAPKRLYSWDLTPDEDENPMDDELQLPKPTEVPVLWHRRTESNENNIIPWPHRPK